MKTMYRLLLTYLFAATSIIAAAAVPVTDSTGIKFFTGTWQGLLTEAKRQNKPIFVDVYTTWCGPCKMMAKQAFPNKAVGEKFNANFVSYQLDAEKGEGIALAKQYRVDGFPTSLYVSANGELLHRAIGYGGIPNLLAEADKAIAAAKDPKPMLVWEKEYESGKRDAAFLSEYLTKRAALGMPNAEALDTYLSLLPEAEQTSPVTKKILLGNLTSTNSKAFDLLVKQATPRAGTPPDFERMQTLNSAIYRDELAAKTEDAFRAVQATKQKMTSLMPQPMGGSMNQQLMDDLAWLGFYKRTKNVAKYRTLATTVGKGQMAISDDSLTRLNAVSYDRFKEETKATPDSMRRSEMFVKYDKMMQTIESKQVMMRLNDLAWTYAELMPTRADWQQAAEWSKRSLAVSRESVNLDTYANLLAKLGQKAEAIKTQEEAIVLAKAAGDDTTDLEKTLAKLKK